MLFKFFDIQWKYPCKNDWTLQVKTDLEDFKIEPNLSKLKKQSKNSFKRIIKIKMKDFALNYLLQLKSSHSKMDNIIYTNLELQKYLRTENIPVNEAKNVFRYRVRVANFKENYKGKYQNTGCPFCFVHLDTQAHAFQCSKMKDELQINNVEYREIFSDKLSRNLSKILTEISKLRENLI